LPSEDEKAVKEMKYRKATRIFGRRRSVTIRLINNNCQNGDWLNKKLNATKHTDHGTISLIANTAKIVAKYLEEGLKIKLRTYVGEITLGLERGKEIRDARKVLRKIS
jgi:hypothetical protein